MPQNGLSFSFRFTIGVAALGIALVFVNMASGLMDIPIDANVSCYDGDAGKSS